jgi:hypothetical protein
MDDRVRRPSAEIDDRRRRLNERLRAAFIGGAEEDSRRRLGRGLTAEELKRGCGSIRVTWRLTMTSARRGVLDQVSGREAPKPVGPCQFLTPAGKPCQKRRPLPRRRPLVL